MCNSHQHQLPLVEGHDSVRLRQHKSFCLTLPLGETTVAAVEGYNWHGQTTPVTPDAIARLLQQDEDDNGRITILPLLFRLGFLRGKIMNIPLQLMSNYF